MTISRIRAARLVNPFAAADDGAPVGSRVAPKLHSCARRDVEARWIARLARPISGRGTQGATRAEVGERALGTSGGSLLNGGSLYALNRRFGGASP